MYLLTTTNLNIARYVTLHFIVQVHLHSEDHPSHVEGKERCSCH